MAREISQLTRINQDLVVTLIPAETIAIKTFTLPTIWAQASWYWRKTMWHVMVGRNPQTGLHFEQIADINDCWSLLALPMKQAVT